MGGRLDLGRQRLWRAGRTDTDGKEPLLLSLVCQVGNVTITVSADRSLHVYDGSLGDPRFNTEGNKVHTCSLFRKVDEAHDREISSVAFSYRYHEPPPPRAGSSQPARALQWRALCRDRRVVIERVWLSFCVAGCL